MEEDAYKTVKDMCIQVLKLYSRRSEVQVWPVGVGICTYIH